MARFLRTDTNSSGGHSRLSPPTVVRQPAPILPVRVQLADLEDRGVHNTRQRKAKSFLRAPVVVLARVVYEPIAGYLTRPRDTVPVARYRLSSPAATPATPAAFVASPISVTLVRRRSVTPVYRLKPPVVVNPSVAQVAYSGPDVTKAYSRRGSAKPFLRLPTTVFAANIFYPTTRRTLAPSQRGVAKSSLRYTQVTSTGFVARPPIVHLAPSARQGREATYDLAGPFVINAPPRAKGRTATQFAQPPRIPTHSRLFPPAVITTERATYTGPLVTLAPSRAGKPKSRLLPVPAAFRPFRPAILHLAPAPTRAQAKYRLSAPTVVAPVLARPVRVELAPQTRGVPKSTLRKPTVVGPVLARAIDTTFARIRPPRTLWVLRKPSDLVDQQDLGYVRTHLAYSLRGRPKPRLAPPTVVAPVLARPVEVTLVRIRPPRTDWALRRPVDLVDRDDLGSVRVHLAPSFRGQPKPRLAPPTVVFPFFARPTDVTLARIRPPKTIVRLAPPTDTAGLEDQGYVEVVLAYSLRGTPKSVLRRPVVIDLRPQTYYIATSLAPSRFPEPKSILREPPKGTPQPAPLYPLFVTLAPQKRGKAKPFLRQTIYAAKVYAPVTVTLAPSRFPRPKSILRKPSVVAPVLARRAIIVVAQQRRGVPKSILRRPTVVAPVLARPVEVTLARIRPARTLFRVEAPIVVNAFVARPARIELAPQRRGAPKSRLTQVVYGAKVYAPISVTLVPSPRQARRPGARLAPPTVVRARFVAAPIRVTLAPSHKPKPGFVVVHAPVARAPFVAAPTSVTLVRARPPKRFYRLAPPAVVGGGIYFRGIQVHLAYSVRGSTMWRLTLTQVVNDATGDATHGVGGDYSQPQGQGGDRSHTGQGGDYGVGPAPRRTGTGIGGDRSTCGGSVTGGDYPVNGGQGGDKQTGVP